MSHPSPDGLAPSAYHCTGTGKRAPIGKASRVAPPHRRGAPFVARRAVNLHGCACPSSRKSSAHPPFLGRSATVAPLTGRPQGQAPSTGDPRRCGGGGRGGRGSEWAGTLLSAGGGAS